MLSDLSALQVFWLTIGYIPVLVAFFYVTPTPLELPDLEGALLSVCLLGNRSSGFESVAKQFHSLAAAMHRFSSATRDTRLSCPLSVSDPAYFRVPLDKLCIHRH